MTFAVGSLVKARGREWVVLPESTDDLVLLRPLGGTDAEVTGIYVPLEKVEPASFDLPDPEGVGDFRSCRLLRDAVRLGFRNSAGPFRSFGKISVEPRPYQLVPLLMGLKLAPVRILIADDVGIGKTIEACLLVRELLDRREADGRMVVLCPPQLAEQWQGELRSKFHIDAQVLLPSTAKKLERHCRLDESVFDVFPYLIVSTDYIKSDRRRDDFLRACPDLVIVDEAHTFAFAGQRRASQHQRHLLLTKLAQKEDRHLILVTATPHSGKEEAFRSLLSFLNPEFANLPDELTGPENESRRRHLAQFFVQRRRGDIEHFLDQDTPFPKRETREVTYKLSPEYKKLFERVLDYARETVRDEAQDRFRRRVRWWSALALLRSLASSPAAAADTLKNRAAPAEAESIEDADEIGRRTILDMDPDESMEGADVAPGGDPGEEEGEDRKTKRRLQEMARMAESLEGEKDQKLLDSIPLIQEIVDDGFRPIVFCRFIPTAEYLARELRRRLKGEIEIGAVTGSIPAAEREARILQLTGSEKRVLVCTDCLSEGINLQEHFDAVVHYDLSWNPTRHEQREGRVDRFNQPEDLVRILTYYGIDNQIDGIVLDVLIRKHNNIRNSLGISVPVPANSDEVIEAIFEGLLLRERGGSFDQQLALFEDLFEPEKDKLHSQWDQSAEREKRSRTMFAQETIKPEVVDEELKAVQSAIGTKEDVERFVREATVANGGLISQNGSMALDFSQAPRALRDLVGRDKLKARFSLPEREGEIYLTRTHPIVDGLANYVLDTALDAKSEAAAKRCGAIRTRDVETRTTLLLLRLRFHIKTLEGNQEDQLLAEDCRLLAFEGSPSAARWLDEETIERLLRAEPHENILPDQATQFVRRVVEEFPKLETHLNNFAKERGNEILDAHRRVRKAAKLTGVRQSIEANLPPDVLGVYVLLPVAK